LRPTRSVIDGRVASRGSRASRNERALKPPDRRRIDAVSAGDVDQALAISEPLERFLPLDSGTRGAGHRCARVMG
jgi:hypothetical protein